MTTAAQVTAEERSVRRWGGLAGIGGGVLFIIVFAIVIAFAGPDPVARRSNHEVP